MRYLSYQLIHAHVLINEEERETWLNTSEDFKAPGESKMTLDANYELGRVPEESALDFCVRKGWSSYFWETLVVDYLILNRDRHGANIEVMRKPRVRTLRPSPRFDHGLSLLCRRRKAEEMAAFDVMAGLPVQSFVGTSSSRKNLGPIPNGEFPRLEPLYEHGRDAFFKGLEGAATPEWHTKVWYSIWGGDRPLRLCSLRDASNGATGDIAYLECYERERAFYFELPPGADLWSLPFILYEYAQRGRLTVTVEAYWVLTWVRLRLVPSER